MSENFSRDFCSDEGSRAAARQMSRGKKHRKRPLMGGTGSNSTSLILKHGAVRFCFFGVLRS